jgi:hypothetical protein
MRQFERVTRTSRKCAQGAVCLLAGAVTACVPESVPRGAAEALIDASVNTDATTGRSMSEGDARLMLDDATRLPDDARMERPDFTVEATTDRIEVHAGGRAVLPLRLARTGGHRAWIELRVSGLPANVSGFFAMSPEADEVALVIEASDQAALVSLQPFTLEANGEGLRRTRRMALTVLPEKAVEE